jgi:hypothetical protein
MLSGAISGSVTPAQLGRRFALGVGGLLDPAVTVFSFRAYGSLLGITAITWLGPDHAEMKSMPTTGITCAPEANGGTAAVRYDDHPA